MALLELTDLRVSLEDGTEIVKGVDLTVNPGEIHALMGPNGSGKSSLAYALMGHPAYEITGGEALFDGQDISKMGADQRAQAGSSRLPVSARDSWRDRDELPALGDQRDPQGEGRRRGRPDPDLRVPQGDARRDGGLENPAGTRPALPQ